MGRRVLEPVQDRLPCTGVVPEPVAVPVTRRSLRAAERSGDNPAAARPASPEATAASAAAPTRAATRAALRQAHRPGTRPAGRTTRRPRGTVLIALGAVLGALSLFAGSAARADIVSSGQLALTPGASRQVDSGMSFADGDGSVVFDVPSVPTGGGLYLGLQLRAGRGGAYLAKARVWADGRVTLGLVQDSPGRASRRLGDARTDVVMTGAGKLNLEASAVGTAPTRLAVRAWLTGQPQPAWQLAATDATSALSGAGALRTWGYLSASADGAMTVPFAGLGAISADPAEATPTAPVTTPAAPTTTTPPATSTTTKPSTTKTSTSTTKPATSSPAPSAPSGGMPGAGNTGVPAGTDLKVHDGDLNANKAGATYDGLDIRGFVNVTAPDVTIKNSIIRGGSTTAMRGVVQSTNAYVKNLLVQDSEIRVEHPSNTLNGIDGGHFTLRRVEISGGVDNVHAFKDDVKVEDSWLHSTNYFSLGANGDGGPSHNDGVQVMGGTDITVTGSRIEGSRNAAIMVTQDAAATVGLRMQGNWLNDGGCTVNIVPKKLASIGPVYLSDNIFGGTTRVKNCPIAQTHSTKLIASNNVNASDGKPAKINVWN